MAETAIDRQSLQQARELDRQRRQQRLTNKQSLTDTRAQKEMARQRQGIDLKDINNRRQNQPPLLPNAARTKTGGNDQAKNLGKNFQDLKNDRGQREADQSRSLAKNLRGLNQLRKQTAEARAQGLLPKSRPIGIIGYIMLFLMLCFAILIDGIPFITGDLGAILDWILDASFFFFVAISLMLTTGDIINSIIGRRMAINFIQTILEFIPVIDVLPIHIVAVAAIYFDLKYGIFNITKRLTKAFNA